MTALCRGSNRTGRGNASPETALVRAAFARFHDREGRAPDVPELVRALAERRIVVTPERVRVHLNLAGLRAGREPPPDPAAPETLPIRAPVRWGVPAGEGDA